VMTFIYENLSNKLEEYGKENRKLTFYAPDKLCVGGIISEWKEPDIKKKEGEVWHFWNSEKKRFLLGDFNEFASYLETFIGFKVVQCAPSSENKIYVVPSGEKHEN